ncbi:hypothetical protein [Acinetobacter radioresistens]|uniref:hypothetical protein n=3 Tax=Acinetobacter radioresistens TaxID=40216 RepID=UPI00200567C3|nr:hypothetical protein [Acinetobacter radioresistens]
MTVSKVLGAQAGIQYSGVKDKSEADPTVQLLNGVIFGRFKRGRFDKPFKVTSDNIRSKLGYDPTNKDYVAVEDALANGAPFVWVMRVTDKLDTDTGGSGTISCAGATNEMTLVQAIYVSIDKEINPETLGLIYKSAKLIINGKEYNLMTALEAGEYLIPGQIPKKTDGTEFDIPVGYLSEWVHLKNATDKTLRLKFDLTENNEDSFLILPAPKKSPTNNMSYYQGPDKRILEVCLSPSDLSEIPEEPTPPAHSTLIPYAATNDGKYIYGRLSDTNNFGLYPLNYDQVDLSNNLIKYPTSSSSFRVQFSGDDSIILDNYMVETFGYFKGSEKYDTQLTFDTKLRDSAKSIITPDGKYILSGSISEYIKVYERLAPSYYGLVKSFSNSQYFTGLTISPDGTKVAYLEGSADLAVYNFENGNPTLIGIYYLRRDEAQASSHNLGDPFWISNDLLGWSYTWNSNGPNDPTVIEKATLDVIRVTNNSFALLTANDIGKTYYNAIGKSQNNCTLVSSLGDKRLIKFDETGALIENSHLPEIKNDGCVLLPNGYIAYQSNTYGKVELLSTLN